MSHFCISAPVITDVCNLLSVCNPWHHISTFNGLTTVRICVKSALIFCLRAASQVSVGDIQWEDLQQLQNLWFSHVLMIDAFKRHPGKSLTLSERESVTFFQPHWWIISFYLSLTIFFSLSHLNPSHFTLSTLHPSSLPFLSRGRNLQRGFFICFALDNPFFS